VYKVHKDRVDHKEYKALEVYKVYKVHKGWVDHREHMDRREPKDHEDYKEWGNKVYRGHRVQLAHKDLEDCEVIKGFLELHQIRVLRVLQEVKVDMDLPEVKDCLDPVEV
jgi:uncharacterized protein YozE (UPF0346 family)